MSIGREKHLPKDESGELTLRLWGFPAAVIVALGLTMGTFSIFVPWASKAESDYYLFHSSLFLVRTFVQLAMVLGWAGTLVHQLLGKRKAANSMWIASCIISLTAVTLILDFKMALHQGSHLCIASSVITAIGTFLDMSKFEVVVKMEKENGERSIQNFEK